MRLTPLEPWIVRKIGHIGERLERADLERYQIERFNQTLRLARANPPFYRRHLANAPADLAALDDLARFPFTTAQDLRAHPLQFLCTSQDEIKRVVTLDTSGTTGDPKRIYFTRDDQELTIDFFRVGMSTFTEPGDRVLILLPCERPGSVGDLLALALERLGAHGIRHGPGHAEAETLAALAGENAIGMVATPTQAFALARQDAAAALRLRSVLLTTDHVPNAIVHAVERAWDCTVYNHYGMTEMGLGGGVDCAARRGYHLREADMLFEIVNPQTGEPVAAGETGEVVLTTLTRRGMPLIRYRTGDLSRFIPGPCPCGTNLKTLARITTCVDGFVSLGAEDYLTMAELDEAIFPIEGVLDFSAMLTRDPPRDLLKVAARVIPGFETRVPVAIQDTLGAIPVIARARAHLTVNVSAQVSPGVRRPGKRRIIDRRDSLLSDMARLNGES